MTTWLAVAALVLAGLSIALFVLAIRRLLSRQANVTESMLRRYDDRLAGFAQVLNDALAHPARACALPLCAWPGIHALRPALARRGAHAGHVRAHGRSNQDLPAHDPQ